MSRGVVLDPCWAVAGFTTRLAAGLRCDCTKQVAPKRGGPKLAERHATYKFATRPVGRKKSVRRTVK